MAKVSVGVLRGGPSSEYEVSLQSGAAVIKELAASDSYRPVDIFLDRKGVWHSGGVPRRPESIFSTVDIVFNALHGEFGEDGAVQEILDAFKVPYTGSGRLASAIAMNKALTKDAATRAGIKTPHARKVSRDEATPEFAEKLFKSFPQPSVVKPLALGSSVGVSVARTFPELLSALIAAFEKSDTVLIEEYIPGREATAGVVAGLRGSEIYALPPIEIVPPSDATFFDYDAKYSGRSKEICPGNFSPTEKSELMSAAEKIHKALGLRHYSRSDFIIHPKRGIYFLEVNTLPGLTGESLLPKALKAVGVKFSEFLEHVIERALGGE